MSSLKLAYIGAGGMAVQHLNAAANIPEADIVAFCDPDAAKTAARVADWQAKRPEARPRQFTDPDAMLGQVDADAVYCLLPPFAHGAAERACLKHGKPFFVEKPIGLDWGLTREIAAAVEAAGLLTAAGYMNRYRAGVQQARALFQADPPALAYGGWVGKSPNPQPGDTSIGSWWVVKAKSGGQIVEQCTHTFDVVRFLCGEAVEVTARAATGFNRGIYNYSIDDASSVVLQLANGGVVNLMSACLANAGGGGVFLNVYAHDTTCLFTGWDHAVKILRTGRETQEIKGEPNIFEVEDRAFLTAVATGDASPVLASYPDAARTLQLTLAANESIATGRPVAID